MQASPKAALVAVWVCACGLIAPGPAEAGRPQNNPRQVEPVPVASNQILVRLNKPAHAEAEQARTRGRNAFKPGSVGRIARTDFDALPTLRARTQNEARRWNVDRIRPMYFEEFAHPELAAKHGLDRVYIVEVPEGTDTPFMAAAFAELDEDVELAGVDTIGGVAGFIPNDPSFSAQWSLRNVGQSVNGVVGAAGADIDAGGAWEIHTGIGGDVIVAIIDSGVTPHVDFGDRMVPGRNTDNPIVTPNLTTDGCSHGTHVAGIALAGGHNSIGVAGVNWGGKIMPVRVLGTPHGCTGTVSALANGIIWAADNGADVANISLQYYNLGTSDQTLLQNAINYATEVGVLIFAATGNNAMGGSVTTIAYPARMRNTVAVGGTNALDQRAYANGAPNFFISNYGTQIDLTAPGSNIYATLPTNNYGYLSGTSMATPHVSGLASLLKSFAPTLFNRDILDLLFITSKDLGEPGWDEEYGFGRINAADAMTAAEIWPTVLNSIPGNHSIDARQATDIWGFFEYGWDSVEFTLPAERVAGANISTFRVLQKNPPNPEDIPLLLDVTQNGGDSVTVYLDRRIPLFEWTTVAYEKLGSVTMGFLPGDVDANRVSNANDVLALRDVLEVLNAEEPVESPLPYWSTDLDRSGNTGPLDLLTCVDLLNGADAFDEFLNKTLP